MKIGSLKLHFSKKNNDKVKFEAWLLLVHPTLLLVHPTLNAKSHKCSLLFLKKKIVHPASHFFFLSARLFFFLLLSRAISSSWWFFFRASCCFSLARWLFFFRASCCFSLLWVPLILPFFREVLLFRSSSR